ncbi:MAG: hypothetical protein GTO45_35600 [Candidatus Aminicenantes bacterium]|nr:hypothetical protein [Candidatus Aminicenantes bacterium]NIM84002.1 hypothetical protein [Candidatus Aminicenantes bacterium]NIN23480.1 hypothetical protein [Candidatus Aminicenantes bacterium]NIN47185.1 hypothetical protein [Candidatus Aminicenantes bacterium]NIN90109.1 hypothetical protein [Candidatus Aminicenantes bacterium]
MKPGKTPTKRTAKQNTGALSPHRTANLEALLRGKKEMKLVEEIGDLSHIPDVESYFSSTFDAVKQKYRRQIEEHRKKNKDREQTDTRGGRKK